MKIYVQEGQNILDIALQYYGKVEGAIPIAETNNLTVTEILEAGQAIELDDAQVIDRIIVDYYAKGNVKINTGRVDNLETIVLGDFYDGFSLDFFQTEVIKG